MNRTLDVLKRIYKPYRLTLKGRTTILETTSGSFVVKPKRNKDIKGLYAYLKSRSFDFFPNLVDDSRDEMNVYEYLEDVEMPKEQKALDMIDLVALLHNKTTYYKEVSEDTYKEIYEAIDNNIGYLNDYYNRLFDVIFESVYMSPSEYSLIRNSSKIMSSLHFCKTELDDWYESIKDKTRQRVVVVHNALETDHYIKGEKEALISWEKSKVDSPVLDLINFYKKEHFELDFEVLINRYVEGYNLTVDEKKLFFVVIALPPEIKLYENEYRSCQNVRSGLDYIYKTEKLIRPYYSEE